MFYFMYICLVFYHAGCFLTTLEMDPEISDLKVKAPVVSRAIALGLALCWPLIFVVVVAKRLTRFWSAE